MRTIEELREVEKELTKLTGFISEHGYKKEVNNKDFDFACNVTDTISWVLMEIETEHFKSDSYINIEKLRKIAYKIEIRTGVMLDDFE